MATKISKCPPRLLFESRVDRGYPLTSRNPSWVADTKRKHTGERQVQ